MGSLSGLDHVLRMVPRTVLLASKAFVSRKVFYGTPVALHRSEVQWRGRSFTVSIPSNSSEPQKVHKKVSKLERRTMVEAFVNEYRASNAGRFPPIRLAQQRFGGSHYTIRQILQEMEYELKMVPVIKRQEICVGEAEKGICPGSGAREETPTEVEGVSSSDTMTSGTSQSSDVEARTSLSVKTEENQKNLEMTEIVKQSFSGMLTSKEEENASITSQDVDRSKVVELKGSQEEDVHGAVAIKLEHKESIPKRPTVWGSLKSLADGIINLWKKM